MLGTLKSGETVVDRHNSHLHESARRHLSEVLGQIESAGRDFLVEEIDLGRVIGETICVATGLGDQIIYAKRPRRHGLTRFVKGSKPESCRFLVVILKATREGGYVLITAFIGRKAEPEPWDRNATEKSEVFWSSHALIWGSEEIVPGTETSRCPW